MKGVHPAHQEPSSRLGIQYGDAEDESSRCPGCDVLAMHRLAPALGQLLGSSARISVLPINNSDVLSGHLQPSCSP